MAEGAGPKGTIEVRVQPAPTAYFPFLGIPLLLFPTVTLDDDRRQRVRWYGSVTWEVAPGRHVIRAWAAGAGHGCETTVDVPPGGRAALSYRSPMVRGADGRLTVTHGVEVEPEDD